MGIIKKNRQGKSQVRGFYVRFLRIDFYKLFLNLLVIALFGFIIWSAIQLFSGKFLNSPLIGSIVFFIEIIAFIFLCIHFRANSWRPPNIILTTLVLIAMAIIMTFAGVQPLSGYKDTAISNINTYFEEQKQLGEQRAIEQQQLAEQREASDFSQTNPFENNNISNEINNIERLSKIEYEVVDLVNGIRASRDTPILIWDDNLYVYSKAHSEEMSDREQLFHTAEGMSYAENCWGGEGSTHWDATNIVDGWMSSPKHRTWLLCPNLKHVAVGVALSDNGMYASWTFWVSETNYYTDWWYCNGSDKPPDWWY